MNVIKYYNGKVYYVDDGVELTPSNSTFPNFIKLNGIYIQVNKNLSNPPFQNLLIRKINSRNGSVLIDRYGRNAELLSPISYFSTGGKLTFPDLTGVTIVSYDGSTTLSISGNDILGTVGTCKDLALSNGWHFPLPHLGVGFDPSNNTVEITTTNVTETYSVDGNLTLIENGFVKRTPHSLNEQTETLSVDATGEDLVALGYDMSLFSSPVLSVSNNIIYCSSDAGVKGLRLHNVKVGKKYKVSFFAENVTGNVTLRKYIDPILVIIGNVVNGYNEFEFIATNPQVWVLISGLGSFSINATQEHLIVIEDSLFPNKALNTPAYPLEIGDTLYKGSTFLNESNFIIDFLLHDATLPAFIFDKSRTDIWKPEVQASDWFDIDKPHRWHSSELTQQFFYDNIQDDFRYILWTKDFKDIFVYSRAMDKWRLGARIEDEYFFEIINDTKVDAKFEACSIQKYVSLYETITDYTAITDYCRNNTY